MKNIKVTLCSHSESLCVPYPVDLIDQNLGKCISSCHIPRQDGLKVFTSKSKGYEFKSHPEPKLAIGSLEIWKRYVLVHRHTDQTQMYSKSLFTQPIGHIKRI